MGFTGIDYYSAMLLLAEIGHIHRFPDAKKLVSYAGLAPGTRQSADRTIHGHIVKEGNKRIRWVLVEAAQHASRHDPGLRQFYLRILRRRGYQKAIVAVPARCLSQSTTCYQRMKPIAGRTVGCWSESLSAWNGKYAMAHTQDETAKPTHPKDDSVACLVNCAELE